MVAKMISVLAKFGVQPIADPVPIGSGHINRTYKVKTGDRSFILQQINTNVFRHPEVIATNLELTRVWLQQQAPEYLFISPLPALDGSTLVYEDGSPWRLYPYYDNTYTIDEAQTVQEAREAAIAFARFGRLMKGCEMTKFRPTIPRFHDLSLRYQQFEDAKKGAHIDRLTTARIEIQRAERFHTFVDTYERMIASGTLTASVFHNDTKINNVLFDGSSKKAMAVLDLDTVMEGYFIYDLGDLVRTLVSPAGEEEKDLTKVQVRKHFYEAVVDGYMTEMGNALSADERKLAPFAGLMMTYIMAIRFLADYLRGDTYYHIKYPEQNLVRARNQLALIEGLKA